MCIYIIVNNMELYRITYVREAPLRQTHFVTKIIIILLCTLDNWANKSKIIQMCEDLGAGGTVSQNLRWDGPSIRSPNISRSSVIGCVAKYELTNTRCHEGMFCSERRGFRQENGLMCYIISDL